MICPKFANTEHTSTRPMTYLASWPRAIYNTMATYRRRVRVYYYYLLGAGRVF